MRFSTEQAKENKRTKEIELQRIAPFYIPLSQVFILALVLFGPRYRLNTDPSRPATFARPPSTCQFHHIGQCCPCSQQCSQQE